MFTKFQQILLLIAFLVFLTPNFISASAQTPVLPSFPVALPNCADRCGNISIPYPFGTTRRCARDISYWVTCNESSNGPTLFMYNTNIPILEISLTGQLRVTKRVASQCYSAGRLLPVDDENSLTLPFSMAISNTANQFNIVCCDSYGDVSGRPFGGQYSQYRSSKFEQNDGRRTSQQSQEETEKSEEQQSLYQSVICKEKERELSKPIKNKQKKGELDQQQKNKRRLAAAEFCI